MTPALRAECIQLRLGKKTFSKNAIFPAERCDYSSCRKDTRKFDASAIKRIHPKSLGNILIETLKVDQGEQEGGEDESSLREFHEGKIVQTQDDGVIVAFAGAKKDTPKVLGS